jgi:tRNA1Val (adenine37-N6)-methyltransferase
MANIFFQFKRFIVFQDNCAFKVTTDACILGVYPDLFYPDKICDIGTGTGILSLMMAQKFPEARINAVEIDELSAQQASENIKRSPWSSKIHVYHKSIQDFAKQNKGNYDLVICNPPYFEKHLQSTDQRKNLARHNDTLSISELIEYGTTLLKKTGMFYSILPPHSYDKLKSEFMVRKFNLVDKLEIFSAPDKPLNRIVSGFSNKTNVEKRHSLTIHTASGGYTEDFKRLLKDYYLAF